jgi:YfiH family protein
VILRWDAPGCAVAFSTRVGGVSDGPFASLNLGLLTEDEPGNVEENRRRLCAAVGANPERLAMNRQEHAATVRRASAGRRGEPGDGLWTDEPDVPMLKVTADCVPIAVADARPTLALLHAGWRGLLQGVVAAGVAPMDPGARAAIGPSIGPCCYEVGADVAGAFAARFGPDVVTERSVDLWTAAERALREASVVEIERLDLCTSCNPDLFFSHRRDRGVTGRQGVIGHVLG